MFKRIKKDLEDGAGKVKWFASLLSERVRIELSVFRLLYETEELRKRRDGLLKHIGEEVYHLRGKEKNVYANKEIAEAIREMEELDPEIKESLDKVSEISKLVS
jgi:hypothetical protein